MLNFNRNNFFFKHYLYRAYKTILQKKLPQKNKVKETLKIMEVPHNCRQFKARQMLSIWRGQMRRHSPVTGRITAKTASHPPNGVPFWAALALALIFTEESYRTTGTFLSYTWHQWADSVEYFTLSHEIYVW